METSVSAGTQVDRNLLGCSLSPVVKPYLSPQLNMLTLTADPSRHAGLTAVRREAHPRCRACKNPACWILYRNAMSHCAACSRTSSTLRRLLARALPGERLDGPANMFVRISMRSCLVQETGKHIHIQQEYRSVRIRANFLSFAETPLRKGFCRGVYQHAR